MYKLKGGLPYNTDCFSYWQGTIQASYAVMRQLLFYFTDFFRNKLGVEDEIKIKIKFIQTIFQLNPSILIQLENGPNEFYFYFTN